MTDKITDREFTAMLIGSRENVLPIELMIHVIEKGGTLSHEQRENVERLHRCATAAMDGLISSMSGLNSLMSRASINELEQGESINVTWLHSILTDLLSGTHVLESDTLEILHRSDMNAAKVADNVSDLSRHEGLRATAQ